VPRPDNLWIESKLKPTWRKSSLQKGLENKRKYNSKLFQEQEEECHLWLAQNLRPRKKASIMVMLEQRTETDDD